MDKPAVSDGQANAVPPAGRIGLLPRAKFQAPRPGPARARRPGRVTACPRPACPRTARPRRARPGLSAARCPGGASPLRRQVRPARPRVRLARHEPGSRSRTAGAGLAAARSRPGTGPWRPGAEGWPSSLPGARPTAWERPQAPGRRTLAVPEGRPAGGPRVPPASPGGGAAGPGLAARRYGHKVYFAQVAASHRGGFRHSAAIAARESGHACDQGSTTFSNKTSVQSNIFGFVMT